MKLQVCICSIILIIIVLKLKCTLWQKLIATTICVLTFLKYMSVFYVEYDMLYSVVCNTQVILIILCLLVTLLHEIRTSKKKYLEVSSLLLLCLLIAKKLIFRYYFSKIVFYISWYTKSDYLPAFKMAGCGFDFVEIILIVGTVIVFCLNKISVDRSSNSI